MRWARALPRLILCTALCLFVAANATAQPVIVIHDVTIIDGTGAAPREHADLVLRDGRIASLEDARTYTHPPMRV